MEKIMVSVLCLAYNHEKYVRKSLESIVNQKTNFQFEVIVHDDASTDGTADIIREFEKKYPDIVKPVYQTENQYSKHARIHIDFLFPRAVGKYFAFCECDDYWTDEYKLQKQVDYMEAHPECTFCIHNAVKVDVNGNHTGFMNPVTESRILTCEEVIKGGGGLCSTNSILAPMRLARELPPYFEILSYDMIWQMYLASCGTTYCFADEMSAYRAGVAESWSRRVSENKTKAIEHIKRVNKCRRAFDEYTSYKYHDAVQKVITDSEFSMLYKQNRFKELNREPYKSCARRKALPFSSKVKLFVQIHFPFAGKIIKN